MKQNNNVDFEQLISFHPTFIRLGDQPTLKDIVFDYFEKYNEGDAKKYMDEIYQVFCNQRRAT